MVTRQHHVRDLSRQGIDPLLPQIPITLIQHAHIATLRAALVRDLAFGERHQVFRWDGESTGELGRRAVVADWPVILAREDAGVPVISIRDVSAVPGEGGAVVNGLNQLLEGAAGVGVAHVIEHGDGKLAIGAGLARSGEAQYVRGRGAIGSGDLVVVGGAGLQAGDLNLMEELTALGDGRDHGAWRGAVIAGGEVLECV